MHPVIDELYKRATFACPFENCSQKSISYSEFGEHIFKLCKNRIVECLNGCNTPYKASYEASHRQKCINEVIGCNACKVAKVRRSDMKNHLEKECPNSSGTCHRCHGFYKATEEHDCIVTLREMITAGKAAATEQSMRVTETFNELNEHVQNQMEIID